MDERFAWLSQLFIANTALRHHFSDTRKKYINGKPVKTCLNTSQAPLNESDAICIRWWILSISHCVTNDAKSLWSHISYAIATAEIYIDLLELGTILSKQIHKLITSKLKDRKKSFGFGAKFTSHLTWQRTECRRKSGNIDGFSPNVGSHSKNDRKNLELRKHWIIHNRIGIRSLFQRWKRKVDSSKWPVRRPLALWMLNLLLFTSFCADSLSHSLYLLSLPLILLWRPLESNV